MREPTTAYIGLGSNLGRRHTSIQTALEMLSKTPGVELVAVSDLVESPPLGQSGQNNYINAVAKVRTTANPVELHKRLQAIEDSMGRVRRRKWEPRIIDLDLLLFGDEIIDLPDLTVPHPQMHLRSFVLRGLCQLDSRLIHPLLQESVEELAARLGGENFALDADRPQLVSIAGIIGVGKTTLAKKLAAWLDCKAILEAYDKNPFLPQVYQGRRELALDSQLYFLNSRLDQLNHQAIGPSELAISDYIFDKELIYAKRLLNSQQLDLYKNIYDRLSDKVLQPVLVLYLQDSVENCLQRIRQRGRPYERAVQLQFLKALDEDYRQLFDDFKRCPVIRLSMSRFDAMSRTKIIKLAGQVTRYVAVK